MTPISEAAASDRCAQPPRFDSPAGRHADRLTYGHPLSIRPHPTDLSIHDQGDTP